MEQMLTDFSCFEFLLTELVQLSFKVLRRQYHCNHGFTSSQGNFSKFTYTTSHGEAVARRCSIKRYLGTFIKKETRTEFFVKFLRTLFFTVCLRATFLCLKNVIKLSQKEKKSKLSSIMVKKLSRSQETNCCDENFSGICTNEKFIPLFYEQIVNWQNYFKHRVLNIQKHSSCIFFKRPLQKFVKIFSKCLKLSYMNICPLI